jgi:hypothetical protein
MNWEGCRRELPLVNLRYYVVIYLVIEENQEEALTLTLFP